MGPPLVVGPSGSSGPDGTGSTAGVADGVAPAAPEQAIVPSANQMTANRVVSRRISVPLRVPSSSAPRSEGQVSNGPARWSSNCQQGPWDLRRARAVAGAVPGAEPGYPQGADMGARGPRSVLRTRPSFAESGRIDAETRSPDAMMIVMDDLEAVARMGTAQLRAALVIPPRQCRHCGVELADRPGPGRPLVWCANSTAPPSAAGPTDASAPAAASRSRAGADRPSSAANDAARGSGAKRTGRDRMGASFAHGHDGAPTGRDGLRGRRGRSSPQSSAG